MVRQGGRRVDSGKIVVLPIKTLSKILEMAGLTLNMLETLVVDLR